MKLLLVLSSKKIYFHISLYVKPLGFELLWYRQAYKAMDNIDEIDPNAIIISARDFPRHWKTVVQFIRHERSRQACPIILLRGTEFTVDEASKASFLGVSGLVTENMDNINEIIKLQGILTRYLATDEKRQVGRFKVEPWQRFGFVFNCPGDNTLITGEIKDISSMGFSFLPDNPFFMKDAVLNMELRECSFRTGDLFLSPVCRVARTGRIASLEFISFPPGEKDIFNKYMENLPLLGLNHLEKIRKLGAT